MNSQISLSSMWSLNYENMSEFVRDASEFGFTHLELNIALTPEKLKELSPLGDLHVSSVHAPCPNVETAEGLASTLSLSSFDEDERCLAIEGVKRTIDLAVEVGAEVVVVHAGYADMNPEIEKDMRKLCEQGRMDSQEFEELKAVLVKVRQFMACPHVDAAKESLLELAGYARSNGIRLGLENRVNYHEIPNLDEMMDVLGEFQPEVVGYWHDVGHAEIQSRIGFTPHKEWLISLADRMVGVHLHDVRGLRDHCAPGTGDLNWDMIARHLPENITRVCEIGEWNDPEDARDAVTFLKSKGLV